VDTGTSYNAPVKKKLSKTLNPAITASYGMLDFFGALQHQAHTGLFAVFSEFLTLCEPYTLSLRLSGMLALLGGHLSSLIQVVKFSERPSIVPHEIQNGPNAVNRALSLINLHAFICETATAFPSRR
jgi:hypothetical protein